MITTEPEQPYNGGLPAGGGICNTRSCEFAAQYAICSRPETNMRGECMNQCSCWLLLMFALLMAGPVTGTGIQSDEVEMSPISGGIEKPRRHFRLKNAHN